MFKRPLLRYGDTPDPVTPYQKAAQVWDERMGSARVQARNWRVMAFACLGLAIGLSSALIWFAGQSRVTPYVIEIKEQGSVQAIGPAIKTYQPSDAQIAFHLARFIENFRALPADPVVVRQNWLSAYDYAADKAINSLNAYARENDPFAKIGSRTVSVQIVSVVRASETSFQVRWQEQSFENGAASSFEHYTGLLSVHIRPPTDEQTLRKNPLGLYVHALHWSQDLKSQDLKSQDAKGQETKTQGDKAQLFKSPSLATEQIQNQDSQTGDQK